MCGRFTLRTPAREIAQLFDVTAADVESRYNIAPSQDVASVRLSPGSHRRELAMLHWGLIPFWADDPGIKYKTINARAETVATKPAYRQAFRQRRCLIPADGFYEWQKTDGKKQPFYIHMEDDHPFAFAGLWERWKGDGEQIESCTIIVTEPNELIAPIHDRMPVILRPEDYNIWLAPEFRNESKLQELLRPYGKDDLEAVAVSTRVNNPKNDSPECIEPISSD